MLRQLPWSRVPHTNPVSENFFLSPRNPVKHLPILCTQLGGEGGIGSMSNKLTALSSNAGAGGISGSRTATDSTGGGLSGFVTGIKEAKNISELLTPEVEAGVAEIELEKARLQATMDNVRQELDKISVGGKTQEELNRAQTALEKAKTAVAPIEGWQNRLASDVTQALKASLQDHRLALGETGLRTG